MRLKILATITEIWEIRYFMDKVILKIREYHRKNSIIDLVIIKFALRRQSQKKARNSLNARFRALDPKAITIINRYKRQL